MPTGKTPGSATKGIKKIFATGLTEVMSYDAEGIHCVRFEGNDVYKYLQYKEGTAALDVVAGDVLYYLDYEAGTVTADFSDTAGIPAGVVVAAAVTADAQYIWVQIKGLADLANDITGSAGQPLTGTGGGDKTLVVGTAAAEMQVGVLLDATASANKMLCNFPF